MVTPNREIANINPFITSSAMSNLADSNCVSEDIQMGALRGRSTVASVNSSRELSVLSKASSVEYTARMEAQNDDPSWANQTEDELFQLLYATLKGGESNIQVPMNNKASEPMPHVELATNTCPQVPVFNSVSSSLPYVELQPGNPDSWDGRTNLISLFGQNDTQEIDVNNIMISFRCISDFISNRELKNNREEDIPFLSGFGQIAFDFVSFLFKGGWDSLKIDINNKIL